MLAFVTLVKRPDGGTSWSRDALFPLPAELLDAVRLRSYMMIDKPGWSTHEFGYRNYASPHENGDLYIFPALIVKGEQPPKKRFPGYAASFSKNQIELYADQLRKLGQETQAKVADEFNLLVHDLRNLSNSIYHAAEEAIALIDTGNSYEAKVRMENVIGAQSMLKIRTDVLDYSGAPTGFSDRENVPIYRRVDKVIKSFSPFAAKKGIKIRKEGSSFGEASGPNVFEIVPYALIDNAIKYSPRNNDITVKFDEGNGRLRVLVTSVGPLIESDERLEIFKRGGRGRYARKTGSPGSGVGLFLASRLVGEFRGELTVQTSQNVYLIDEIKMTDVTFVIDLPVSPPTSAFR